MVDFFINFKICLSVRKTNGWVLLCVWKNKTTNQIHSDGRNCAGEKYLLNMLYTTICLAVIAASLVIIFKGIIIHTCNRSSGKRKIPEIKWHIFLRLQVFIVRLLLYASGYLIMYVKLRAHVCIIVKNDKTSVWRYM